MRFVPPAAPPRRSLVTAALLTLVLASAALAIHPGQWVHTTEADWTPGKRENTVVTNLGDVKLSVSAQKIGEMPEQAAMINDMQFLGNDLYLAVGPEGKLLRQRNEKITEVVSFRNEQVFSLDVAPGGKLLLGISGPHSRLAIFDGDKVLDLVELPDVRYIWDMVVDAKAQAVYLATGIEGRLLKVDLTKLTPHEPRVSRASGAPGSATAPASTPADDEKPDATAPATGKAADGKPTTRPANPAVKELLHTKQANILCLGRDAKGNLYAGTDTNGLVYRITEKAGASPELFVLYNAPEPEIGALLVLPDGTVYAGTADAEQARAGRLTEATSSEVGRPEAEKPGKIEPGNLPMVPPKPQPPQPRPPATQPTDDKKTDAGGPAMPAERLSDTVTPSHPATFAADPTHVMVEAAGTAGPTADAPAKDAPKADEPAEPTQEQRDRLREVIRQRLEAARKSGAVPSHPSPTAGPGPLRRPHPATGPNRPGGPSAGAAGGSAREGNAVYRIDPNGFVTEVFRESVMILKIMQEPRTEGRLLVATGNEGHLYRLAPAADETTIIADLEPQQISAMTLAPDGRVLLGTSNPATLVRLDQGYAAQGTFTSMPLDASQISLWGHLRVTADIPAGTKLAVETRSGNVEDPDQATWSSWSTPVAFEHDDKVAPSAPREINLQQVGAPPARFLQYRLTLSGDQKASPVVDRVGITYVVPNLKPVVKSIKATYPNLPGGDNAPAARPGGGGPGGGAPRPQPPRRPGGASGGSSGGAEDNDPQPATALSVEWEASDPNNDQLRYRLEYRAADGDKWLTIADDLDATNYEWNTKRVPDGRYLVRVTASDAPDNPPDMAKTATRTSDPVLINNTPPTITPPKVSIDNGVAVITTQVQSTLSPLQAMHYAVDSTKGWKPALPDDLIFDSTKESVTIKIAGLSAGPHVITLRATDAQGNSRYLAVPVEMK